jgi:hypothetical protein
MTAMNETKLSAKLRICSEAAGAIDWAWLIKEVAALEFQLEQVEHNHDQAFDDFVEAEREINTAIDHLKTAIYRLNK